MSKILRHIPIVSAFVPPPAPEMPKFEIPSIAETAAPSAPAPTSDEERKAVEAAQEEEKRKQRSRAGRTSTILTSPIGASLRSSDVFRKTLLGG